MATSPGPDSQRAVRRRLGLTALVAAALFGVGAPAGAGGSAAPADDGGAGRPTVVLVHGAFTDTSSWNPVIERLQRRGYRVLAPADPLRGLAEDSAYVASVLRTLNGPLVVVGHSYGGAVISSAAAGLPQVKALVYVAAYVPDRGEELGSLSGRFAGSRLDGALQPVPFQEADGSTGTDLYIRPDRFPELFAPDVPAATAAVMAATQRPVNASAFSVKAQAAAWRSIPSWALVATQDRVIAPALERFEARRAHSHTVEVASSHAVMVSHADAVTDLVLQAARAATPSADPPRALASTGTPGPALAGAAGASLAVGAGVLTGRGRRTTGRRP